MIKDKQHAKMVTELISLFKIRFGKDADVKVEVPYNWYGSRGVIDIVVDVRKTKQVFLYEVKPTIEDIGGAIRQVTNQQKYYPPSHRDRFGTRRIVSTLILLETVSNVNLYNSHKALFDSIKLLFFNPTAQDENLLLHNPSLHTHLDSVNGGISEEEERYDLLGKHRLYKKYISKSSSELLKSNP